MDDDDHLIAPYAEWAIATDFAYLEGKWFRVLLELRKPVALLAVAMDEYRINDLVRIPPIYRTPARGLKAEDVVSCMAIMTKGALKALVKGEGDPEIIARLKPFRGELLRLELGTAAPAEFSTEPYPADDRPLADTPPRRAVVAVIDDGIAFAHERFRSADRKYTRFKFFWNQDDLATSPDVSFGREFKEDEINDLLDRHDHGGYVDEDALYREAGQDLAARRAKHGTHVMDVACGLDADEVAGNSPYLIGVQLPKWVTHETSGELLTPLVHLAIAYILDRADDISLECGTAPLPIVINLSYGTIAGPHDGTGQIEAAIDRWIAAREPTAPLRVVLPAGNHYLARCHARFTLALASKGNYPTQLLHWRVQPDDKASSIAEIYFPRSMQDGSPPELSVRITMPDGHSSGWIQPGGFWLWPSPNPSQVRFQANNYAFGTSYRRWVKLIMSPTAQLARHPRTAPSGTWKIEIRNESTVGEVEVNAWVQRGDTPFSYPLWGRQSRFDDDKYVRFDPQGRPEEEDDLASPIRRRGTQNAMATGNYPVVIGGFRRDDGKPSRYSGAGPVATRTGPDAAAIADDSVAMHGILAAGTRSGSVIALDGTSVAAPQITRLIAEWMTAGMPSDRAAVHDFAYNKDPGRPLPGSPEEQRLGGGRIRRPEPIDRPSES
jgi:hypothetical protein